MMLIMVCLLYQRWIKKTNRRVRYTRPKNDVPASKRVKLTPWQVYMKDFGQTDGKFVHIYTQMQHTGYLSLLVEGKDIMKKGGTKEFAQTASRAYKSVTASKKEELKKRCSEQVRQLTVKDIKHDGYKIFKNMDKQVTGTDQMSQNYGYEKWNLKAPLKLGNMGSFQ